MNVQGHDLTFDPVISLNTRYLSLLTQVFAYDSDVTRHGEYIAIVVKGRGGEIVFLSEAKSTKFLGQTFDVQVHTTNPGPYVTYVLMTWYYPGYGTYSKTFRVQAKISQKGNLLNLGIGHDALVYSPAVQSARGWLYAYFKKLRNSGSGPMPRPALETTTAYVPKIYRYSVHPEWSSTNLQTNAFWSYRRAWTGERTPGYWTKRKGQLPVNPHTVLITRLLPDVLIRHTEWVSDVNYGNTKQTEDRVDAVRTYFPTPPLYNYFKSNDTANRALPRLRQKMGAEVVNLAQDIGEIGETIRMIHHTIRRIHNANHALQVGNFPGAINALWSGRAHRNPKPTDFRLLRNVARTAKAEAKVLAQNWLELQYGWKPLLSDVHEAIGKVSRLCQEPGDLVIAAASGSASSHDCVVSAVESNFIPSPVGPRPSAKQTESIYQRDKYGVRFKMADAHKAFLAQTGFTNPISVGWELTPFSFVADWFLPIGPWLESFNAYRGLEFVDGYHTRFQRVEQFLSMNDLSVTHQTPDGKHPIIWYEAGLWWRSTVLLERSKLTTWPLPYLPEFKSPWSTGHVLNALALLGAGFHVAAGYHV